MPRSPFLPFKNYLLLKGIYIMKKIFVTESQFQKIVKESLGKANLNESFSSNYLKTIIMQNGGLAKPTASEFDSYGYKPATYPVGTQSQDDFVTYPLPKILDKLTDNDLLYRATHIEDFTEKLTVTCKNGTKLTIPLTNGEYEDSDEMGSKRKYYYRDEDGKLTYQPQSEVNQEKERLNKYK